MPNEFLARNGLIAQNNSTISGSLNVTAGITGSLLGTASFAATASYLSGYVSPFPYTGSAIISGSLIITGSSTSLFGYTGSLLGTATTASYVLNAVSASYATTAATASYLTTTNNYQMNLLGVGVAPAAPFKGNFYGQVIIQNGINNATGQQSLIFAYPGITNSLTHSIFSGHDASVASYNKLDFYIGKTTGLAAVNVLSLRSSQPVLIGSGTGLGLDVSGSTTISGSLNVSGSITSTSTITAQTLVVQTITSSVLYSSGSNIFGNSLANTQQFTGSVGITGSLTLNNIAVPTSASLASTYLPLAGGTLTGALGGTTATFSGTINSTITNALVLSNNTSTTQYVYTSLANSVGNARYGVDNSSGGGLGTGTSANSAVFGNAGNADVDITTNNISRLKIASTGAATFSSSVQVGSTLGHSLSLGLAAPTTDTLNHIFAGQGVIAGQAAGGETDIGNNWYYYSGWKYRLTNAASNIKLNGDVISFERAASGTANAAITFLESMRITSGGNVGIGTTSPSFQLDVSPGVDSATLRVGSWAIMENVTTTQAMFGRNVAYATSIGAGWRNINTGGATAIRMYDDPGDPSIGFHLHASETAGTSLTSWDSTDVKMTIRNSGKVGIGQNSPNYSLTVNGSIQAGYILLGDTGNGNNSTIEFVTAPNSTSYFTGAGNINYYGTGNLTLCYGGGNVGIGTASPSEKLHLYSASSVEIRMQNSTISSYLRSQSDNFNFYVNGERMRITSAGKVGIATTSPAYTLSVAGTINAGYILLGDNNNNANNTIEYVAGTNSTTYGAGHIQYYSSGYLSLCVGGGYVYVGHVTSLGAYKLQVTGAIYATADITAYSDISVKNNIRPIENALLRVTKSRGVLYDRTDIDIKNNIGFIAQELEEQFPELISTNNDGTKGVKYQNAVAILFEAIKEQQTQIEELKTIINGFTK